MVSCGIKLASVNGFYNIAPIILIDEVSEVNEVDGLINKVDFSKQLVDGAGLLTSPTTRSVVLANPHCVHKDNYVITK